MLIKNKDQRSQDYGNIKDRFRPGHADYTYDQKYGSRDYRGGGRSSARETAIRVAAGGIAKKYLKEVHGIEVLGYLSQLGPVTVDKVDHSVTNTNPFFCPDESKLDALDEYMRDLKSLATVLAQKFQLWRRTCQLALASLCSIG